MEKNFKTVSTLVEDGILKMSNVLQKPLKLTKD